MKTAILTFQDAENYGAALQAYALKETCQHYSEVSVINYYNDYFHRDVSGSGVKSIVKKLFNYKIIREKTGKFEKFQQEYIVGKSKKILRQELEKLNGEFDCFITGSDQVWNMDCSGNDTSYFLDFVKQGSKNSYAASFGKKTCNHEVIKKYLSDYKNISIREKSGKEIIEKCLEKEIPVVLDPTLLLECKIWRGKFNLSFDEKYVLMYEVLTDDILFTQAKQFAKYKGMKMICITSTNKPRIGSKIIRCAGPIEWLQLFAGAAYVFTNSFHGLAFALNFNKQFFVDLRPNSENTNTRIIEMLNSVELMNRDSSKAEKLHNIDYNKVDSKINDMRKQSLEYLQTIFEEGKKI